VARQAAVAPGALPDALPEADRAAASRTPSPAARAPAAGVEPPADRALRVFDLTLASQRSLDRRLAALRRDGLAEAGSLSGQVRWFGVLSAIGVLAGVAGIGVSLRRAIAMPAAALRRASGRLAAGDLTTPVKVPARNEIGEVAGDLEVMRRRLVGRIGALNQLRQLSAEVVGATGIQQLAEVALDGLRGEVGASRAALAVVDEHGHLELRGLAGLDRPDAPQFMDYLEKARAILAGPPPDERLHAGDVIGLTDLAELTDPAAPAPRRALAELGQVLAVRGAALLPLHFQGRLLGVMTLLWTTPHELDVGEEALLGLAGNHLAAALSAALRYEEAERSASEARAVFYAMTDGVALTDPDGKVTAMNEAMAALCGRTEAESVGKPFTEVVELTDERGRGLDQGERPLAVALATGEPVAASSGLALLVRGAVRGGADRRLPVAVSAAPMLDPDGRVAGGVTVVRDVAREREVDEVKDALISTVSHELRTPLTLIHGFAELLVEREMDPGRRRLAADEILQASRRLGRLIDDLLSVSRADSGRLVLAPRPFDLGPLIDRTVSPFRAATSSHSIQVELGDGLPAVHGDPDRIEQVLTNLVSNAIKYSPEGGEITVTAQHAPQANPRSVTVSVRDSGIGMSDRDMEGLFNRFYRVDRDEVRVTGGTGLGLYISRRLIEEHGGRIWAESEPGNGSVFSFTLPTAGRHA
jgi:signal transduction histidine kinase/HAMP domain-containing protein